MSSSSTSVQDGVRGIRFTFPLKKQKQKQKGRQYETMVFMSLDFM